MEPFQVRLFSGDREVGSLTFTSGLLVEEEGEYECEPEGLLTLTEAKQVARELRKLPAVGIGQAGKYRWKEVINV